MPVHTYRIIMTPLSTTSGICRCVSIEGEGPETIRLKRMGICGGRDIEVVQAGDPMIVHVAGARVGLSRNLASRILVESPVPQLLKAASGG